MDENVNAEELFSEICSMPDGGDEACTIVVTNEAGRAIAWACYEPSDDNVRLDFLYVDPQRRKWLDRREQSFRQHRKGVTFSAQAGGSMVGSDDTWAAGRDLSLEDKTTALLGLRLNPVVYLMAGPQLEFAAEAQRQELRAR